MCVVLSVTFEADGFRGKSIKIVVRSEEESCCGFCPQFGDFIVLKEGSLVFQFRNVKGGRRLNLQYKIEQHRFPQAFINKHLPDYSPRSGCCRATRSTWAAPDTATTACTNTARRASATRRRPSTRAAPPCHRR